MSAMKTITELGVEKQCLYCHDFWPADLEFFYKSAKATDGLMNTCKACFDENNQPNKIKYREAQRAKASA